MNYKYVNHLKCKYNPSVVEYSSAYQLFICGTYQLFEPQNDETIDDSMVETLKRVNNRFGNLLLITRSNELVDEFECFDGGVFDMRLIASSGNEEVIITAHSNGFAVIYGITSSNRLQTMRRYETNSTLLTSLATITDQTIVVGNSEGTVVFVDLTDEKRSQLSVTKHLEPIWTLISHRFEDNYLLFVGSDDSLWRVYCLPELSAKVLTQLTPIHVNSDSKAGITSLATDSSADPLLSLIVGSYDEFIRFYSIQYNCSENKINVCFKHKLHINGSGIWRVIVRNDTLLVSGMYSGAHLIVDSKVVQTLQPFGHKSEDNKELIYGLNCDKSLQNIIISSFYCKNIYLFIK